MCLHYSKARLMATGVEAEGVKINALYIILESCDSERLE